MAHEKFNILAIDCCRHILAAVRQASPARSVAITSRTEIDGLKGIRTNFHLIVVGVARFPVRRLILNRLKRFYPDVAVLFLFCDTAEASGENQVRGEFLINDRPRSGDLEMIGNLRSNFPLKSCEHMTRGETHRLIESAMQIITEHFSDPDLTLSKVAKDLPTSPSKLSRILNREVGISFRRVLKQIRIEEAKHLLAGRRYNVKEVAVRSGFSDSHYFSRTFKEVTGLTATEYQDSVQV